MNTSKDQHLASQQLLPKANRFKRLQFAVSKLANSNESIRFDRSKLHIFVELAHIYSNSSTNSAGKLHLAKSEASCEM